MDTPISLFLDWRHQLGWGITTTILILIFHLMNAHCLHTPLYNIVIVYIIIVAVDITKHMIKLQ